MELASNPLDARCGHEWDGEIILTSHLNSDQPAAALAPRSRCNPGRLSHADPDWEVEDAEDEVCRAGTGGGSDGRTSTAGVTSWAAGALSNMRQAWPGVLGGVEAVIRELELRD